MAKNGGRYCIIQNEIIFPETEQPKIMCLHVLPDGMSFCVIHTVALLSLFRKLLLFLRKRGGDIEGV